MTNFSWVGDRPDGYHQLAMIMLGAILGSDVAFCTGGGTAIATGRSKQLGFNRNKASQDSSSGGGIFNNGTLEVSNSAFSNNETFGDGSGGSGAIYNNSTGSLKLNNSTLRDNKASICGGGIFMVVGYQTLETLKLAIVLSEITPQA